MEELLDYLQNIQNRSRSLDRLINVLQDQISDTDKGYVNRATAEGIITQRCIEILEDELDYAIQVTEEFKDQVFTEALFAAFTSPRILDLYWGPEGVYRVEITPDYVAGDVEDWFEAVRKTREAYFQKAASEGRKERSIAQRSVSWKRIFKAVGFEPSERQIKAAKFNPKLASILQGKAMLAGTYLQIIKERTDATRTIAPFWYILEHGTLGVSAFGEGGDPYPITPPTRFVTKAEARINSQLPGWNAELTTVSNVNPLLEDDIQRIVDAVVTESKTGDTPEFYLGVYERRVRLFRTSKYGRLGVRRLPEVMENY